MSLTVLAPVTEVWGLEVAPVADGIAAMFRRGKLHSFAVVGQSNEGFVTVPIVRWATLRMVADRAKVASAVYVPAGDEGKDLWYVSFPPSSGLDYASVRDPVHGCVVSIPKSGFAVVKKKEAA